ncbi:MAG: YraN family protein [Patescibacteria group bacterium]
MKFLKLFLRPRAVPAPHLALGKNGEETATHYLRSLGYRVRDRNVRLGRDEIDLIAFDPQGKILVFVEVKTRGHYSEDFPPSSGAGPRKWKRLRRGIGRWILINKYDGPYRIDLVSVVDHRVIEHARGIGEWM